MRTYITAFILLWFSIGAYAQSSTGTATDLSVPMSPAFSITDITPTLIQNPATPKSFALGVAQSFEQSGTGFPNNYSAEFAPIWWINPKGINVYSYLGLSAPSANQPTSDKENVFAGIKFTTVSVAFINKDLIPDTSKSTQNIFSVGMHTTLIKWYGKKHTTALATKIDEWEKAAQKELADNVEIQTALAKLDPNDTAYKTKQLAILKTFKETETPEVFKDINNLLDQKPYFAWDIAAALAVYGISKQDIETGRVAVWTSFSSYIPLSADATNNYFNINVLGRYLVDNFQKNDQGVMGRGDNKDIGGNIGFEFNKLSIAVESLYRFTNGIANTQNRTVGVINVKLADNIFVNGTFGKDFAGPNKLISAFGINWGFGKEKVSLPIQ